MLDLVLNIPDAIRLRLYLYGYRDNSKNVLLESDSNPEGQLKSMGVIA